MGRSRETDFTDLSTLDNLFFNLPPTNEYAYGFVEPNVGCLPIGSVASSPLFNTVLPVSIVVPFSVTASIPNFNYVSGIPSDEIRFLGAILVGSPSCGGRDIFLVRTWGTCRVGSEGSVSGLFSRVLSAATYFYVSGVQGQFYTYSPTSFFGTRGTTVRFFFGGRDGFIFRSTPPWAGVFRFCAVK